LTQFVGRDVINKNTTDLAVCCSTGSVELSCVAIDTPLCDKLNVYALPTNDTTCQMAGRRVCAFANEDLSLPLKAGD